MVNYWSSGYSFTLGGAMKKFEKVLFALDFSEHAENAFDYALSMAKNYEARLLIIHVIHEPVDLSGFYVPHISFENLEKEIREGAERMMEKFCSEMLGDYKDYQSFIVSGIPYQEILKKAEEEEVSLIVMGTQGRKGIDHFLFGSNAEKIVRNSRCPVLTVRLS
jgi:nucleotide-binding universal stress UspA family protein